MKKPLWKAWQRFGRNRQFRLRVMSAIFVALTAVVAFAAYMGAFTRDIPPRLPSPYYQTQPVPDENGNTPPQRYDVINRAEFEKALALKAGDDDSVTEVRIYGHVDQLVITQSDRMRERIVNYGEDPQTKLTKELDQRKVAYKILEPYKASWFERQSQLFMTSLGILSMLGLICGLLIWDDHGRRTGRVSPQQNGYIPGYGGLGLGGGAMMGGGGDDDDEEKNPDKKTFDDVAGCEEAIAKLKRVRKWLRHSLWYSLFKAKIPKGVLLVGPPGTGKTLLAQALAGETDANYFSISASEFVEMYVGVGASRVRGIFDKAIAARKKTGKPSIIFIDELDAVAKKRSSRGGGGDSERDQTLNQLLTCMQGFKASTGILVIAATNLAESLDPAVLRPGRFDYHVSVDYPDIEGREKIFGVHTRGMQLAPEVNLRELAKRTSGMAGAHIELICSEAGVVAAEEAEHLTNGVPEAEWEKLPRLVTLVHFDKAIDMVQFGDELLSRMRNQSDEDKMVTCVHEAGHAVVATKTGGAPVTKITRAIRSKSLGMMQAHPEKDQYGMTEDEMRGRIMTALGGRAAQLEFKQPKDTGASNDFEQANRIARFMVGAYGMSDLGPIQLRLDDQGFPAVPLSPNLAGKFDDAWTKLVNDLWEETVGLVKSERERIDRIAKALFVEETILGARYKQLYDGTPEAPSAEPTEAK